MIKSRQTSIRVEPARWDKWRRLAADAGVSPNEAIGLLIDNAEKVQSPAKVAKKANGAEPAKVTGAALV